MALGTFFSVALGGLAEAVAGKSLDLGIEGAKQAQKTLRLVEQQPLSELGEVVQATVDAARQDVLDRYKYGEDAQKPGVIQDLVRQLEHPPFAREVAQHLLFGGQIDFQRLQRVYLQVGDTTTERWAALQPYLREFFAKVEQRLLKDLKVGPLLVATRSLAVHIETARRMELLTAAAEQMQGLQGRTARATERSADASERMAADIARLLQKFDEVIAAYGRGDGARGVADVSALSEPHLEYLRSWFAKPWTNVKLAEISRRQDQASLLDVYVPLQVDCNVVVQVKDHVITEWWIATENDERTKFAELAQMADAEYADVGEDERAELLRRIPKERSWRDLGVDEAVIKQIVDGIQRKITERRADGEETEDGDHRWYMEAHDAASVQSRFVLLGDPGGGKSSFLRHLTLCQAGELRRRHQDEDVPENANLAALKDWLLTEPLTPIYIELRDLVRLSFPPLPVEKAQDAALPTLEDLWRYIREYLLGPGQAAFEQVLRRLCREGEAMLLLDGLDEVPMATDPRRRQQIKSLVAALHGAYPRLRMVISGRPHAYRRGEWEVEGFGRAQLEPLDGQRLYELAQALFRVVLPQNAEAEAETFVKAILRDPHIDRSLHANPLFFTMLAAIWFNPERPGQLPATKADLYRQAVDLLLDRWTRNRLPDTSVIEKLGMQPKALRPMLETLACTVHKQSTSQQDSTLFSVGLLLGMLYECEFNVGIKDVPDYLTQHAGILISPAPGELAFVHRSFQEHLAASELICVEVKDRLPLVASDRRFPQGLLDRVHAAPDLWENVARLAADDLAAQGRMDELWRLLVMMGRPYLEKDTNADAAILALEVAATHGLLAVVRDEYDPHFHASERLRKVALKALTDVAHLAPAQRARVGRVLGSAPHLDTRPGVGLRPDSLPDIDWVQIPEVDEQGRRDFLYGEKGERRREPTFWMARYPVTYAQFQAFVDAEDGLRDERWFHGLNRTQNIAYYQHFQFWNHPREKVTWYQAIAFCRWLTAKAKMEPAFLPPEARSGAWRITLPTEWQWEKAARGHDGRTYPWGNEYISGYANVDETEMKNGPHKLGQTSAVGIYPQGVSPYGILDMSGNVWEWCLNEFSTPERFQEEGDELRVFRGGSWGARATSAKASSRNVNWSPRNGLLTYGFRCVVVPITHG